MSTLASSAKSIFLQAVELPAGGDRLRFLDAQCGDNIDLRREVEELLCHHAEVGDFLESPPTAVAGLADTLREARSGVPSLDFLSPADDPASLGKLGHYSILELLGQGGFGVVLKALDEKLQRIVAIKTLSESLAASLAARQRFAREARAGAAINHDNVVRVYAVEETGPVPYLVMEHIAGVSLEQKLRRDGPLPVEGIAQVGLQIAAGLAEAHRHGLVHRDIKPANILIESTTGRVKITDFGLARAVDDASLSREGMIAGTPEYMSPEQARGQPVDHRTDLFSLGSVLYSMCTGRPPFEADGSLAVLARVANDLPPAIRSINPAIPVWLANLIGRLHSKSLDQRVCTAAEVAELLSRGLGNPFSLEAGADSSGHAKRSSSVGKWRSPLVAVVLLALTLVGYLAAPTAWLWMKNHGHVEIATNESHLQLHITKGSREIRTVDLQADRKVELDAGDYELELLAARGDQRIIPAKARIHRGFTTRVAVHAEPGFVGQLRCFFGTHQVLYLACSPDGRLAAAACGQKVENGLLKWVEGCPVVLWDLESAQEQRRLIGHLNTVRAVAFSPDGQRISSACTNQRARVWDAATGEALSGFETGPEGLLGMAFSSDGSRLLGGGWDSIVRLWDMTSGKELCRCTGHAQGLVTLALSPDGRRGLSGGEGRWDTSVSRWFPGSDYTLRLWDLDTCQELRRLEGHTAYVACVTFSADGQRALSGSEDKTVRLWDVATGDTVQSLTGHTGTIRGVAFSRDGRRALSAGEDATVRLWDLKSGTELHCFQGHQGPIRCVVFCPDNRHALSGGDDATVRLWQLPDS